MPLHGGEVGLTWVVALSYSQPVKSRINLLCFTWGHTAQLMHLSFKNYSAISYIIIFETSRAWGMSKPRIRAHTIILWVALELINLSISIIQLLETRCILLLGTYLDWDQKEIAFSLPCMKVQNLFWLVTLKINKYMKWPEKLERFPCD